MEKPFEIQESPNKPNVTYSVKCIQKEEDHEMYFEWLVKELKSQGTSCERTIIYCQTIKQCSIIYGTIKGMLGNDIYFQTDENPSNVLVEMLHSCTPPANKEKNSSFLPIGDWNYPSFGCNNCIWNGGRL